LLLLLNSWVPVYVGNEKNFSVMSVGFLLENQDDAVVWRGPKKSGKIYIYIYIIEYLYIIC